MFFDNYIPSFFLYVQKINVFAPFFFIIIIEPRRDISLSKGG